MIQRWFAEDLTEEQVIGQILQVLQICEEGERS